jgi:hypothetical protein
MPRRAKDYRVQLAPDSLHGAPTTLEVRCCDESGDQGRVFDFRPFSKRLPLAAEMALAFRFYAAGKSLGTQTGTYEAVIRWFRFLDDAPGQVSSARDVDLILLRRYLAWLERAERHKSTRVSRYGPIKRLFSWLMRNRPDLVSQSLEFPFAAHTNPQSDCTPREILSKREIESVLAAARKEIDAIWSDFQHGCAVLARADRQRIEKLPFERLELEELETVLAAIQVHFGGVIPAKKVLHQTRLWKSFYDALQLHGGIPRLSRMLYATSDTLTPYLLVLGATMYANSGSLVRMQRDCMIEHVLLGERCVVTWHKHRAGRPQRRSFMRGKKYSVPNLIEQVLALTAPLVPFARAKNQNLLFLCRTLTRGKDFVGPFPKEMMSALQNFVARNQLVDDRGKPMHLALSSLRGTGLSLAHAAVGGDVLKTQQLANHAQPSTTVRYVDRPAIRRANEALIGELQTQFVHKIRKGTLAHIGSSAATPSRTTEVSASGFGCRDPWAGIAPGQKKGSLCTAWLGCFTCPNAVIPLQPEVLARLLAMREVLFEARDSLPEPRWQLAYSAKLEILERDILPRFSAPLFDAAMQMLPGTFRPPRLE